MPYAHALMPGETPASGQVPRLSHELCRSLLATASSGYLALSQSALPSVVPVTCVLDGRSEEHTSELSHLYISYAVFFLKKTTQHNSCLISLAARSDSIVAQVESLIAS